MRPRIKLGLIIGAVGLVINVCVSAAMGICGPFLALIVGALSGFLTARQEKLPIKSDSAKAGAISGLIAGGLVLIGQLLGGIGALILVQMSGTPTIFGMKVPEMTGGPETFGYIFGGLATGVCFGLVGVALSAGAGALAAYLSAPDSSQINPPTY